MIKPDMCDSENALAFYREFVRALINENSTQTIENDCAAHAKIIISELICAAKDEVFIFCKKLSSDIWGTSEIVKNVQNALDRGVRFHVMVQDVEPESSALKRIFSESSVPLLNCKDYEVFDMNFSVFDGKAFRFERFNGERKGVACANNTTIASELVDLAKRLMNLAKPAPQGA